MSRYVDGFVIPIKKNKMNAYKKMAKIGYKTWMKYGALDYYECVGANIDGEWGTSFRKAYKIKKDETLIFAFIVYKSKAHRNAVNKKVHKEFAEIYSGENQEMPFDQKRFSVGEFTAFEHS